MQDSDSTAPRLRAPLRAGAALLAARALIAALTLATATLAHAQALGVRELQRIDSPAFYDRFGQAIETGDVDGNGKLDLVVAAPSSLTDAGGVGAFYLYLDRDLGFVAPAYSARFDAPANAFWSGEGLASLDFDGDGRADLVSSYFGFEGFRSYAGALLLLSSLGTPTVPLGTATIEGGGHYDFATVAPLGDWNADGWDDLAIAHRDSGETASKVSVFFGGPGADRVEDVVIAAPNGSASLGFALLGPGDVDGDGVNDLVVADAAWPASSYQGIVYLYRGGASPAVVPADSLSGDFGTTGFGATLGRTGDVNGDGFADFLVNTSSGVRLALGATGTPNLAGDYIPPGESAPITDLEGDGLGDFAIATSSGFQGVALYHGTATGAGPAGEFRPTTASNLQCSVAPGPIGSNGLGQVFAGFPFATSGSARGAVYRLDAGAFSIVSGAPVGVALAGDTLALAWSGPTSVFVDWSYDAGVSWGLSTLHDDPSRVARTPVPDSLGDAVLLRLRAATFVPPGSDTTAVSGPFAVRAFFSLGVSPYTARLTGDTVRAAWRGRLPADLEVSLDGTSYRTIATGLGGANTNEHRFALPLGRSSSVSVRVTHAGRTPNPFASEWLGSTGSLAPAAITLAPGGVPVFAGDSVRLGWRANVPMDAEWSEDDGATWSVIASDVRGAGEHFVTWRTGAPTSAAFARVRAHGEPPSDDVVERTPRFRVLSSVGRPSDLEWDERLASAGWKSREQLGSALAHGDWNGDGRDDLAVGATGFGPNSLTPNVGRVWIYFGGSARGDVPDLTISGESQNARFGRAIAFGDWNADGFDDLCVGELNVNGSPFVRVFFGGPSPDSLDDYRVMAPPGAENFGSGLAFGDVNGDGLQDLVVRASMQSAFGLDFPAATVWVYFGGPTPHATADRRLEDALSNATFSFSTTMYITAPLACGDWNGDGLDDVLAGYPGTNTSGANGSASLFFGTRAPDFERGPDRYFAGHRYAGSGERLGFAVAFVGDHDGDGWNEIAIGAPWSSSLGNHRGRVYLYSGGGDCDTISEWRLDGARDNNEFGHALAPLGDLNHDGFDDLAVGAPYVDSTAFAAGRVYVYCGFFAPDAVPELTATGTSVNGWFGAVIAPAGDRDQDGFTELAIGEINCPANSVGAAGRVHVRGLVHPVLDAPLGGETWVAGESAEVRWRGPQLVDVQWSADGGASWSTLLAAAGGANANRATVAVPDAPTAAALVRIVRSGLAPLAANSAASADPFRIARRTPVRAFAERDAVEPASDGALVRRSGGAGDVNGDGRPDVFTLERSGATLEHVRLAAHGRDAAGAPLALGEASFDVAPRARVEAVAAGDLDGDGFGDLAVSECLGTDPGAQRVRIFRGGAALASAPVVLEPPPGAAGFGAALAGGSDLDGDGRDDLAVGAPATRDSGSVYVYAGGAALGSPPVLERRPPFGALGFGAALAIAGDLDGDGRDELAVGAVTDVDPGRVLVYRAGEAVPALDFAGAGAGDRYGAVLARGGDVDGDGFDDLWIGAPALDAGGLADAGGVDLVRGRARLRPIAMPIARGAHAGEALGAAIAAGIDVDGDGFADALAGAPFAGGEERGEVRLYAGAVVPDTLPRALWRGARAGNRLGAALALAPGGATGEFACAWFGGDAPEERALAMRRWWLAAGDGPWYAGGLAHAGWSGAELARVELAGPLGTTVLAESAGGADTNSIAFRVPVSLGTPVRVRLVAGAGPDEAWSGPVDVIAAIALERFEAAPVAGGVRLAWTTTPGVGPAGLRGYRLERIAPDGARAVLADTLVANEWSGAERERGARYELSAIDGYGAVTPLGTASLPALDDALRAWPQPARGGGVTIELAAPQDADGRTPADFALELFDVTGRRVATLARGSLATEVGRLRVEWGGRFGGRDAPSGIYFLRAHSPSAGWERRRRILVASSAP